MLNFQTSLSQNDAKINGRNDSRDDNDEENMSTNRNAFVHGFCKRFQFVWIILVSTIITLSYTMALYFTSKTSQHLVKLTMQMANNSLRVSLVTSFSGGFHQYF